MSYFAGQVLCGTCFNCKSSASFSQVGNRHVRYLFPCPGQNHSCFCRMCGSCVCLASADTQPTPGAWKGCSSDRTSAVPRYGSHISGAGCHVCKGRSLRVSSHLPTSMVSSLTIQKTIYLVELTGVSQDMPSKPDQSLIKTALLTGKSASDGGYEPPPAGVKCGLDNVHRALCARPLDLLSCQQERIYRMMNMESTVEGQTQPGAAPWTMVHGIVSNFWQLTFNEAGWTRGRSTRLELTRLSKQRSAVVSIIDQFIFR
jgi:hypothetical protein